MNLSEKLLPTAGKKTFPQRKKQKPT